MPSRAAACAANAGSMAASSPTRFHTCPSVDRAAALVVVEQAVGLCAQRGEPAGVPEHVARAASARRPRRRATLRLAQLAQVEVDELEPGGPLAGVHRRALEGPLGGGQRVPGRGGRRRPRRPGRPIRRAAAGA